MFTIRKFHNHADQLIKFEVGHYDPVNGWFLVFHSYYVKEDHNAKENAARLVHYLNGGDNSTTFSWSW